MHSRSFFCNRSDLEWSLHRAEKRSAHITQAYTSDKAFSRSRLHAPASLAISRLKVAHPQTSGKKVRSTANAYSTLSLARISKPAKPANAMHSCARGTHIADGRREIESSKGSNWRQDPQVVGSKLALTGALAASRLAQRRARRARRIAAYTRSQVTCDRCAVVPKRPVHRPMPLLQTAGHPCHTASRPPGPGVLRLIFSTFGLWPAPPRLFSDRVAGVMEPLRWRILGLGSSVAGDRSSVRETLILIFTCFSRRHREKRGGTVLPSADSCAQG